MNTLFKLFVSVATLIVLGSWGGNAHAAACASQATGNWNTAGTWNCGHVPASGDTVTITLGNTVTLNANSNILASLTVNGVLTTAGNSGSDLYIGGNIVNNGTINMQASTGTNTIYLAGANITSTFSGTGTWLLDNLDLNGTGGNPCTGACKVEISGSPNLQFINATLFAGNSATFTFNALGNSTATVTLNRNGNQAVPTTGVTYPNLIVAGGSGNNTPATGTITVLGSLTINSGSTWAGNTNNPTTNISGDLIITGTYTAGNGTTSVSGNFTNNGTFTRNASTINFNGSVAQNIAGPSTTTFNNLTVANTGAGNTTLLLNELVAGNLSVNSGTLDLGAFTANRTAAGGTITVANVATLMIGGTNTFPTNYNTHTLGATSTVTYNGTNQSVAAEAAPGYGYLTLSGSGTKTAAGSFIVRSDLTINSGVTLASVATVQTVNGNVTNNGTQTATTGSITLSGGTAIHTLSGNGSYANLILNDALGATLAGSPSVSGVLTLTSGIITTGANTLEVTSSCLTGIAGASATRYVLGNLRLHYPTAAGTTTCTFPIGDATAYTPAVVAMTNVSSTLANSTLTASTTPGDHPDTTAGTSGIDPAKSVNRYWTLTPGGSLNFATYSTTFNFVAGDIDAGANTANFVIARKNAGAWSDPTMGAANPTNTTATGMTQAGGFGQYAIGQAISISGTVFEDFNYGGGAGRSLGASAGVGIGGARVELYTGVGAFVSFTTSSAGGTYLFDSLANGTYIVRIASNGTTGVRSTRTGGAACATCVPVQTYRTNASSGIAIAVTDHVGGENPALLDAADNNTSATLASLTTGTTTAQSITTVTKGAATVTGVDFGFNFDTIVSILDAGQGSLRQFIVNSNALGGEGSLSQNGLTGGLENSIFMIPNGVAHPGLNAGYANQLAIGGSNAGAAVITLTSALPAISGASTGLDATTQTANVGDTNFGTLGTGGTVGVSAIALPQFNRPEVVISAAATQLSGTGSPVYIKGLAVSNGGIIVAGANSVVQDCLAGMDANGTVSTVYGASYGIIAGTGTNILISHDYVKVNNSGIRGDSPGANLIIEYNEVDSIDGTPGGGQTNTFDGILIVNSASNVTVQYNLVKNQRGGALEFGFGTSAVTGLAQDNTLMNSGFVSAGSPSTEGMGIAVYSLGAGTAITLKHNIVTGSARSGIAVVPGATATTACCVTITQNSIYNNGTIGIDLNPIVSDPNSYTPDGVTMNDNNDADNGPNGLLNFPILASATISGTNLILTGWSRPGSTIELFIAAPDPTGFGEGKTYMATLGPPGGPVSTYGPAAINGLLQGTDTSANSFSFTIPLSSLPGVASGTMLTATATLAGTTSEFSGNVMTNSYPTITMLKTATVISDPVNGTANPKSIPGAVAQYTIIATNSGGPADSNSTVFTDPIPANTLLNNNPVTFTQGTTSSTLTYTAATDLSFSNNGGSSYGVTPAFDPTTGCDITSPPITNIRINPKGTFVGGGASFQLTFTACVQ